MENDVFKNKIVPWQEKGRWYHAHIVNSAIDADNTDKYLLEHFTLNAEYAHAKLNDNKK